MDNNILKEIKDGAATSFIDGSIVSKNDLRPKLLYNNYNEGQKVLCAISDELSKCDEFYISVAFITMSGLVPLLQTLYELEEKGIKGKILTTDYLCFSEPKALSKIHEFKNIELKMYVTNDEKGFHTKGYIFKDMDIYRIIIGSSNLTMSALTLNKEWNTKVISSKDGEFSKDIIREFNEYWNNEDSKIYEEFFYNYEVKYNIVSQQKLLFKDSKIVNLEARTLKPNLMQIEFIENLRSIIDRGEKRALLISATGTGKTYASAFALRTLNPKKALFVVHREQIAKQALKSYRNVFGENKSLGILSGNSKDIYSDIIFSTIQTLSKDEVMKQFSKEEFDLIVIDEVHRAGAESYDKIMNYFKPKFYLGMTASPDRMDHFDIYGLFHNNIAHEIRLQEALENNLLCPFHYFGITDIVVDNVEKYQLRDFNELTSNVRVDYIIKKIRNYGYSGDRAKGLVFTSTKKEAARLSEMFNERGFRTDYLTGENTQAERESLIERLISNDAKGSLDYIFTVDIFNEGVDIPEINQVILLRPTESPIIFIQQLGRGLRKAEGKEYVVIIDFIGNYTNNYMIPMALFGDRSYNKDNVRKVLREGNRIIPGASTVNFDEISKKRIYESIDKANFSDLKLIKDAYSSLKNKLGRIPSLMDFEEFGSMDPLRIFENKQCESYYGYLSKYEEEYTFILNPVQKEMLRYISQKLANGKRATELIVLRELINGNSSIFMEIKDIMINSYGLDYTDNSRDNLINILSGQFLTGTIKKSFDNSIFISYDEINGKWRISESFSRSLRNDEFKRLMLETIDFGLLRNKREYSRNHNGTPLNLYKKYTYEDVCRLLDWETAVVAQNIGGYKFDQKTNTMPVFINYHKDEGTKEELRYEDRFIDNDTLIAISKNNRYITSEEIIRIKEANEREIRIELFVRKNKDDRTSKEFYYLGRLDFADVRSTPQKRVEIEYNLRTEVREDIYHYLTT